MLSPPGFAVLATWILASVIGLGLAGCYNPPVLEEGAPCQRSEQCPRPQQCVLGSCSLHAPPADAASSPPPDARADAMIDAMEVACMPDGLSCGNTTPTVFKCGTQCWAKCTSPATRMAAETACTSWGGALGEIDDATEQSCVAMKAMTATSWIGAIQNAAAMTPGEMWFWNGDPTRPLTLKYTNWASGEPEDGGNGERGVEQCANIRTDGTWDDAACSSPLGFFCRRPTLK